MLQLKSKQDNAQIIGCHKVFSTSAYKIIALQRVLCNFASGEHNFCSYTRSCSVQKQYNNFSSTSYNRVFQSVYNHDRIVQVPYCHASYSVAILRTRNLLYAIQSYRTALRLSCKFSRGPFITLTVDTVRKTCVLHRCRPPRRCAYVPQERDEVLSGSRSANSASRSEHRAAAL